MYRAVISCLLLIGHLPVLSAKEPERLDRYGDPLPHGASARLGTTRFRPSTNPASMAISSDSKFFATAEGSTVRLWEMATGKELWSACLGKSYEPAMLQISPDRKSMIAVGSQPGEARDDSRIFLLDMISGKLLREIKSNGMEAFCCRFILGGKQILISKDDMPIVCDVETGKEIRQLPGCEAQRVSPDGQTLAGITDSTLRLWNLETGREITSFKTDKSQPYEVKWSGNGKIIGADLTVTEPAKAGRNRNPLQESVRHHLVFWDIAARKELSSFETGRNSILERKKAEFELSPDGKYVAIVTREGRLSVRTVRTGQEVPGSWLLDNLFDDYERLTCQFEFAADGTLLISDRVHGFRRFDVVTGQCLRADKVDASDFQVSADCKLLITRSPFRIQDLDTGRDRTSLDEHAAAIEYLCVSEKDQLLVSHDRSFAARLWDTATGRHLTRPKSVNYFLDGGKSLVGCGKDDHVQVWEPRTGKGYRFSIYDRPPIHTWEQLIRNWESRSSLTNCQFSRDGRVLAVQSSADSVVVWDVTTGKRLAKLSKSGCVWKFTDDGKWLVLLDFDGANLTHVLSLDGQRQKQFRGVLTYSTLAFSANGRYYTSASEKCLRVFDMNTDKECWSVPIVEESIDSVDFTDDSARVVVGSVVDRTLTIFDVKTGKEVPEPKQAPDEDDLVAFLFPESMKFQNKSEIPEGISRWILKFRRFYRQRASLHKRYSSDVPYACSPNRRIIACAGQGEIRLVESRSGRLLAAFPQGHRGDVNCLLFTADGRTLITGSGDSTILLWDWEVAANLKPDPSILPSKTTWDDLAHNDVGKAYRAMYTLLAHPNDSINLLKEHLKPATKEELARMRQWIAELDHDRYAVREQAQKALLQSGEEAVPLLRAALKKPASFESEMRIRALLASPELLKPGRERMREARAIQVLQSINTQQSHQLLEELAQGETDAFMTREAQAVRKR